MKDYQSLFSGLEKLADLLINFLSAYIGYLLTEQMGILSAPMDSFKLLTGAAFICLFSLFFYGMNDLYRPMRAHRCSFFIKRIILLNIFLFSLITFFVTMLLDNDAYFLFWIITSFFCSVFLLVFKKLFLMSVLNRLRSNNRNIKHILLMTDSQEMAETYLRQVHLNPNFGYEVIGYVGNLAIEGLPHLGQTTDLDTVLHQYEPDEVVMAFETVRKKVVTKYVSVCEDNCIKVLAVPAFCGFFKSPRQVVLLGDLPIMDIRSTPLDNPFNRALKRAMDIVISSILIILTSPIMLMTAIGVRISSPGPILFKQTRIGMHNKEFTIYKFRSMRVNSQEASGWTTDHDVRKTKFGNFIRRFSIDELPQFFNVLRGDMSIIGPRPEMPVFVEEFRKTVPLYMVKHSVRPGITGRAQILGLRGDTSIERRVEEDIYYIETWSFWEDLRILFLTPFHAVNKHEKKPQENKGEQ